MGAIGFVVKADSEESYLAEGIEHMEWNCGKHAFVEAFVFDSEAAAEAAAAEYGGRVICVD